MTAPSEQAIAADGSFTKANLGAKQESSDLIDTDSDTQSVSGTQKHSGLNASRFNSHNVDLLGENSGSWTGALAQNKSYMHDLASILWTEDFEIAGAEDPEIAQTVESFARMHFN